MSATPTNTWQRELGIDVTESTGFFARKEDIDTQNDIVKYAHIVRRAFDLFELDGVWCDQTAPLVYFKVVDHIGLEELSKLHRRFWNHGGAAVLAIITPHDVQIYSGLSKPDYETNANNQLSSFVVALERSSQALEEFLPSVESGEFFRKHAKSFDTRQRVDQSLLDNLQATREELAKIAMTDATTDELDAFLCRLVFTCYLFDREVIGESYLQAIGLPPLPHLRNILGLQLRSEAKEYLYRLFHKLAQDFNGDLFSDDLDAEAHLLTEEHLNVVEAFFRATLVTSGQQAMWPYDFSVIPIETVSAIYERFLKPSDREQGAFYTPRFLAELVLDIALSNQSSLLGLRFLDPACGSGIFLVGLFNRLAEEWRRENPQARNDQRARELLRLMQESLFGVDLNPTACRIAAFSLYLAYLDQLTPRDIQELQAKGNVLPRLVIHVDQIGESLESSKGGILCGDFFDDTPLYPTDVDVVVGNPPWGSIVDKETGVARWCKQQELEVPNKQIAAAFMWKVAQHISDSGQICLLLPHGILFNHNPTAINFQKDFIEQHSLDLVLNLTDYQSFLFSQARHPALVLQYGKQKPERTHAVKYWTPKADWKVTRAEVITISEYDRTNLPISLILTDLEQEDAPQIWKRATWATPRDRRLLDRLNDLPRLRDYVRGVREKNTTKTWIIAEGFQPIGQNDDPEKAVVLKLPSNLFIEASSPNLNLFLLESDCTKLESSEVTVRGRSNKAIDIFHPPHVLVAKGFSSIAFSDFPVAFRHALRGISGPVEDRNLLIFLTAYLRSSLAQYFLFHTSSNWGVSRNEVHVRELLRLPFLLPSETIDAIRAEQIVEEVANKVMSATQVAKDPWVDRDNLVEDTQSQIEPLIFEYFDILPSERILIEDTIDVSIPSFRPSIHRHIVPAIEPSSLDEIDNYVELLCETLNKWGRSSNSRVVGSRQRSPNMGVGLVVLDKGSNASTSYSDDNRNILTSLNRIREASATRINTFELIRGVKVFDGSRLYIMKPLGRRYWTQSAALNDADEIAASILMQQTSEEPA